MTFMQLEEWRIENEYFLCSRAESLHIIYYKNIILKTADVENDVMMTLA